MRVFLTGNCDGLAELRDALDGHPELDVAGWWNEVRDAAGVLAGGPSSVVLHATSGSTLPRAELAMIREHTRAPIILLASGESSVLLEQALDADVADVLLLPQLAENVSFAVRKARHAGRRAADEKPSAPRGRVVTVFAPKGGTGKSSVATNVAVAFAKHEGKKTLLLDLDLQFGDAAIMLGAEPEKTIYDLVAAPGELDSEKLAGYTMRHPSGLDVLAAPLRPEDAELVTEPKVVRLLEVAKESYDVIVIDTSPFFHGAMLATLDQTDELLILCGIDVPTLKNVRLSLQTLELLSFPQDRVSLVLNQATPKRSMKRSEIEGALGVEVRFEIPYDSDVPAAVNRGNAVVLSGGSFAGVVRQMAKALVPGASAKRKGRSVAVSLPRNDSEDGKKSRWPAFGRA